jgi:hypothetical protein
LEVILAIAGINDLHGTGADAEVDIAARLPRFLIASVVRPACVIAILRVAATAKTACDDASRLALNWRHLQVIGQIEVFNLTRHLASR